MTDKKSSIFNEMAKQGASYDPDSVVLDPAKALDMWRDGKKWRAASIFVSIALMWMPFSGLSAMTRQFAPENLSPFLILCPSLLIIFAVVMTLTLLKRPLAFVLVTAYSLAFIFLYTVFFTWLMSLFATRSGQFISAFTALAVATGIAMMSNRLSKIIALLDKTEDKP